MTELWVRITIQLQTIDFITMNNITLLISRKLQSIYNVHTLCPL